MVRQKAAVILQQFRMLFKEDIQVNSWLYFQTNISMFAI